jgi:CheY-like chemotaxis protein
LLDKNNIPPDRPIYSGNMTKADSVLIIEDNRALAKLLGEMIRHVSDIKIEIATSLTDCKKLIAKNPSRFTVSITDLNLPDAQNGEAVEYLRKHEVPVIVLTGSYDEKVREKILEHGIIDYVVKDNLAAYQYVVGLLLRIHKNRTTKVLIVDDSSSQRALLGSYLKTQLFNVLLARDAVQGLQILEENPDIRLVLTDYHMPVMDGFSFTKKIRETIPRDRLMIVGLSGQSDGRISSHFLKSGADDFLAKPIVYEELLCRINQNLGMLEKIEEIRDVHEELVRTHNAILYERGIIEDTLLSIRNTEEFNSDGIRFLMSPVEKTGGDIILSAKRPDGVHHCMLGDFTGHGLSAALSGPTVADIFYTMTAKGLDAGVILDELNRKLTLTLPPQLFLAACFVEYDRNKSRLRLWNCGLPSPLQFHGNRFCNEFASRNMALGITDELEPSVNFVEIDFAAGEKLYLYTDGIIETPGIDGKWYGTERFKNYLAKVIDENSPLSVIIDELNAFQQSEIQADDITLIEINAD